AVGGALLPDRLLPGRSTDRHPERECLGAFCYCSNDRERSVDCWERAKRRRGDRSLVPRAHIREPPKPQRVRPEKEARELSSFRPHGAALARALFLTASFEIQVGK